MGATTHHQQRGPVRFAILAYARTGSGSLYEFFRELGVDIIHEPLHCTKALHPCNWQGITGIGEALERVYSRHQAMKHIIPHLNVAHSVEMIHWLTAHGCRIIFLRRRDRVARALSSALAHATGRWGVALEDPIEWDRYLTKVRETPLDIERVRQGLADYERDPALEEAMVPEVALPLWYEDLYGVDRRTMQATVERILGFLGMDVEGTDAALHWFGPEVRQNPPAVLRLVPNRAEVAAALGITWP